MTNAFNPTLGWGKTTVGTLANKKTSFSRCKWVLPQIKREDAHEKMPAYSRIFWRWILMALLGLLPERIISPNYFSFLLNCQDSWRGIVAYLTSVSIWRVKKQGLYVIASGWKLVWAVDSWTRIESRETSPAEPEMFPQHRHKAILARKSVRDISGAWNCFTRWKDTRANLHLLALNYHHHYILLRLLIQIMCPPTSLINLSLRSITSFLLPHRTSTRRNNPFLYMSEFYIWILIAELYSSFVLVHWVHIQII